MQPSSTTLHMAAVMMRLPLLQSRIVNVSSALRNYSHFCPLYSVNNLTRKSYDSLHYQTRWANLSSGFYAPSTVVNSDRHLKSLQGNLNVFEDSEHLPSLPLSGLNVTLEKLKESISPVAMNSSEFVNTLQLIDDFSKSAGPKLDLLLRNKKRQTKNWMTHDWWTNEVYLKSRQTLMINSNPSMIYPKLPFEVTNQRSLIHFTSQLISTIIDFKLSLIDGYNPEATSADNECRLDPNICYRQYKSIFGSTRIPGPDIDSVRTIQLEAGDLNHPPLTVVISFRGNFFEIHLNNIADEKSRIDKISNILDKIVDSTICESQKRNGAGVLTAEERSLWAEAYKLLDEDSMDAIQKAQFVVCIDTVPTESDEGADYPINDPIGSERQFAALGRQVLHADCSNIGNRWFDKTLQLIVVADQKAEKFLGAGINYEHTLAEGGVITKMIEYSYDKIVQKNRESSNISLFTNQQVQSSGPDTFRQLRMFDENNDEAIERYMKQAQQDYLSQVDQFELSYLKYKRYGGNTIKSWNFSPDSWFQVALQQAYYNVHKRLGPCYESASTRQFAYGRTETIRSLTKEVAHFCAKPSFITMQEAILSHKAFAVLATNAEAIDRPLMGYKMTFNELRSNKWTWGLPTLHDDFTMHNILKLTQRQRNESDGGSQNFNLEDLFTEDELSIISAFFNNELIKRSSRFALSTSQVSSVHPDIYMCFGPLLADGYGCCYNITGQQIVAAVTANSSNQSFSCEVNKLHDAVCESLDKMAEMANDEHSKSCKN